MVINNIVEELLRRRKNEFRIDKESATSRNGCQIPMMLRFAGKNLPRLNSNF